MTSTRCFCLPRTPCDYKAAPQCLSGGEGTWPVRLSCIPQDAGHEPHAFLCNRSRPRRLDLPVSPLDAPNVRRSRATKRKRQGVRRRPATKCLAYIRSTLRRHTLSSGSSCSPRLGRADAPYAPGRCAGGSGVSVFRVNGYEETNRSRGIRWRPRNHNWNRLTITGDDYDGRLPDVSSYAVIVARNRQPDK